MEASRAFGCPPSLNEIFACGNKKCGKLKYIQPSLRQSFRPSNECRNSDIPMSTVTTSKLSYQKPLGFKSSESLKPKSSCPSCNIPMENTTTYELSYVPIMLPPKEQYPWVNRHLQRKSNIPMANSTIQKLSYGLVALPIKEQYPWGRRQSKMKSNVPMASVTIQKLSYQLPGEFVKIEGCNCVQPGQCLN